MSSRGSGFVFGETPFYFLRHGETDANLNGILQGQDETLLNAQGRRTAEAAAHRLARRELGSIYASPLKRTRKTASIVSVLTGAPVFFLPGLMERHWGIYQGKPKRERPSDRNPEGVESIEDFSARILDAMRSIAGPAPVLVVSHSGVFRVIGEHIGIPMSMSISVGSSHLLLITPPNSRRTAWHIEEVSD